MRLLTVAALSAAATFGSASMAQEPDAPDAPDAADEVGSLLDEAGAAYAAERYRDAAELFERAFAIDPVAPLLFNAAQAWRLAGERARAADGYARALELDRTGSTRLDALSRRTAEEKLAELRRDLAIIQVDSPRGATLEVGPARVTVPARVHVEPGRHVVRLDDRGTCSSQELDVQAGSTTRVAFVLAPPTAPPPLPREVPSSGSEGVGPAETGDQGLASHHVAGIVTLGLGGALGVVTAVLGVQTLRADDDWEASGFTDLPVREEAVRLKTATNVTLTFALATAGAGTILLLTPDSRTSVALGPGSLSLTGRF